MSASQTVSNRTQLMETSSKTTVSCDSFFNECQLITPEHISSQFAPFDLEMMDSIMFDEASEE
jgi:hypothetical protein